MKKYSILLISSLFLLFSICFASAAEITVDSFDRSDRSLNGDTADNGNTWTAAATYNIRSNAANATTTINTEEAALDLNISVDGYNLSILMKNPGAGNDRVITYVKGNVGTYITHIMLRETNKIQLYYSGSYNDVVGYKDGEWVNMTMVNINFTSDTYDFMVNETLYDNGGAHFPFQGGTDNVSQIVFDTFDNPISAGWDGIIINRGAAAGGGTSNFSINASDQYDGTNLQNITAIIDGFGTYTTTNSSIVTNITLNNSLLLNFTLTCNDSGGYFNKTYTNVNASSNFSGELYQAIISFNAFEIYTNNSLVGTFNTINASNTTTLILKAGSFNITFVNSSYYNKTQNFTFTALENSTQNITGVYDTIINFTANQIGGSAISNFTIILDNLNFSTTINKSTTTGNVTFNSLQSFWNATIDAPNHVIDSAELNVNTSTFNYTFNLYLQNTFNFIFRDEITDDLLNGTNVTIEIINTIDDPTVVENTTTDTGYANFTLLIPGNYTFRYSTVNYPERFYYSTLRDRTVENLTLYLLNNTLATQITITLLDNFNDPVPECQVSVLKFNAPTPGYLVREIGTTNAEGQTKVQVELDEEFYKFLVVCDGVVITETEPSYLFSSNINIQIDILEGISDIFDQSLGISHLLTFNNATNNFRVTYTDADAAATEYCLDVFQITGTGKTLFNQTCDTSSAATLLAGVSNTTESYYTATFRAIIDGEDQFIANADIRFGQQFLLTGLGIFAVIVLTTLMVGIGIFNPTVALILAPIPLVFGTSLGWVNLSPAIALGIWLGFIILAFIVRKNA